MPKNRQLLRRALVPVAALGIVAGSFTRASADAVPGVTPTEIVLGGTHPYSGPASAYSVISKGILAYFAYVNDHGGVNGRKITYKDVDDGYNPAQTVQVVKQLAEQDHVFAFFNTLGTPPNLAIRQYLNDQKIPQLFLATGATTWGADAAKYPWTLGFNPDYQAEAIIFGKNILAHDPNAKIAVLYQNDDFGQDYVTGLKKGLGAKASQIVKLASYEVTDPDVRSQMATLKGSGADTLLIAATPKFAVQAMVAVAQLSWKATVYMSNVSASQTMMKAATSAGGDAATEGLISDAYALDPTSPVQQSLPGMKLYHDVISKYAPSADPTNAFVLYGVAAAYTMVDALQKAGKDLTREKLMNAAINLDEKNPFLWPGIELVTTPADRFPIRELQLERYDKGLWVPFGSVVDARK
jgi:ABC-type branched-subunit amino acid transport system substrate-binding protein